MEKEIIGYKLKKEFEYCSGSAKLLGDFSNLETFERYKALTGYEKGYIERYEAIKEKLQKAGVFDIWFEPVYKEEEFKVGEYVFVEFADKGAKGAENLLGVLVDSASKVNCGLREGFKVNLHDGIWGIGKTGRLKKPESSQIENYLIREAVLRGYKEGVRVHSLFHNKPLICKNINENTEYYPYLDKLQFGVDDGLYVVIYEKGKWAKILKDSTPDITINCHKAEFFDNYVKFGCAKISKDLFINLYRAEMTSYGSNKELVSVTIGKGTFTKEQIKEIAEYYINKK